MAMQELAPGACQEALHILSLTLVYGARPAGLGFALFGVDGCAKTPPLLSPPTPSPPTPRPRPFPPVEPRRRPSAEELLEHAFFTEIRDPEQEPTAQHFSLRFEREANSMEDIMALLREECTESQAVLPVPVGPPIGSFSDKPKQYTVVGSELLPDATIGLEGNMVTPLGTTSLSSAQDMAAALATMAPMRPLDDQ